MLYTFKEFLCFHTYIEKLKIEGHAHLKCPKCGKTKWIFDF